MDFPRSRDPLQPNACVRAQTLTPNQPKVVVIEPGHFRTSFLSAGHRIKAGNVIDDLKPAVDPLRGVFDAYDQNQPGDPVKGARLIVDALTGRGQCKGRTLPLRLVMGSDCMALVQAVLDQSKKDLDQWAELSVTTDYAPGAQAV